MKRSGTMTPSQLAHYFETGESPRKTGAERTTENKAAAYFDSHFQICPFIRCHETVRKTVDKDGTPLYLNLDGEHHTCVTVERFEATR